MILEANELKKLSVAYVSKELEKQVLLVSIYRQLLIEFSAGKDSIRYLFDKNTDNSTYAYIYTTLTALGYKIITDGINQDGTFFITITF